MRSGRVICRGTVLLFESKLKQPSMGNVPPGSNTDSEEEDNEVLEVKY